MSQIDNLAEQENKDIAMTEDFNQLVSCGVKGEMVRSGFEQIQFNSQKAYRRSSILKLGELDPNNLERRSSRRVSWAHTCQFKKLLPDGTTVLTTQELKKHPEPKNEVINDENSEKNQNKDCNQVENENLNLYEKKVEKVKSKFCKQHLPIMMKKIYCTTEDYPTVYNTGLNKFGIDPNTKELENLSDQLIKNSNDEIKDPHLTEFHNYISLVKSNEPDSNDVWNSNQKRLSYIANYSSFNENSSIKNIILNSTKISDRNLSFQDEKKLIQSPILLKQIISNHDNKKNNDLHETTFIMVDDEKDVKKQDPPEVGLQSFSIDISLDNSSSLSSSDQLSKNDSNNEFKKNGLTFLNALRQDVPSTKSDNDLKTVEIINQSQHENENFDLLKSEIADISMETSFKSEIKDSETLPVESKNLKQSPKIDFKTMGKIDDDAQSCIESIEKIEVERKNLNITNSLENVLLFTTNANYSFHQKIEEIVEKEENVVKLDAEQPSFRKNLVIKPIITCQTLDEIKNISKLKHLQSIEKIRRNVPIDQVVSEPIDNNDGGDNVFGKNTNVLFEETNKSQNFSQTEQKPLSFSIYKDNLSGVENKSSEVSHVFKDQFDHKAANMESIISKENLLPSTVNKSFGLTSLLSAEHFSACSVPNETLKQNPTSSFSIFKDNLSGIENKSSEISRVFKDQLDHKAANMDSIISKKNLMPSNKSKLFELISSESSSTHILPNATLNQNPTISVSIFKGNLSGVENKSTEVSHHLESFLSEEVASMHSIITKDDLSKTLNENKSFDSSCFLSEKHASINDDLKSYENLKSKMIYPKKNERSSIKVDDGKVEIIEQSINVKKMETSLINSTLSSTFSDDITDGLTTDLTNQINRFSENHDMAPLFTTNMNYSIHKTDFIDENSVQVEVIEFDRNDEITIEHNSVYEPTKPFLGKSATEIIAEDQEMEDCELTNATEKSENFSLNNHPLSIVTEERTDQLKAILTETTQEMEVSKRSRHVVEEQFSNSSMSCKKQKTDNKQDSFFEFNQPSTSITKISQIYLDMSNIKGNFENKVQNHLKQPNSSISVRKSVPLLPVRSSTCSLSTKPSSNIPQLLARDSISSLATNVVTKMTVLSRPSTTSSQKIPISSSSMFMNENLQSCNVFQLKNRLLEKLEEKQQGNQNIDENKNEVLEQESEKNVVESSEQKQKFDEPEIGESSFSDEPGEKFDSIESVDDHHFSSESIETCQSDKTLSPIQAEQSSARMSSSNSDSTLKFEDSEEKLLETSVLNFTQWIDQNDTSVAKLDYSLYQTLANSINQTIILPAKSKKFLFLSDLDHYALNHRVQSVSENVLVLRYLLSTLELRIHFGSVVEFFDQIRSNNENDNSLDQHREIVSMDLVSLIDSNRHLPLEVMKGFQDEPLFNGDLSLLYFEEEHRPLLNIAHDYVMTHFESRRQNFMKTFKDSSKLESLVREFSLLVKPARSMAIELLWLMSKNISQILPRNSENKFQISFELLALRQPVKIIFTFDHLSYPDQAIRPNMLVPDEDQHLYPLSAFSAAMLMIKPCQENYISSLLRASRCFIRAIRKVLATKLNDHHYQ